MLVVAIAQREDGVMKLFHAWKVLETKLLVKWGHAIGGIAISIRAGQDQGVSLSGQRRGSITNEGRDGRRMAQRLQLLGELPREAFRGARLRRIQDSNTLACRRGGDCR